MPRGDPLLRPEVAGAWSKLEGDAGFSKGNEPGAWVTVSSADFHVCGLDRGCALGNRSRRLCSYAVRPSTYALVATHSAFRPDSYGIAVPRATMIGRAVPSHKARRRAFSAPVS
jgi:hypothetical protein